MNVASHIAFIVFLSLLRIATHGKAKCDGMIKVRGVGASFPKTVYNDWINKFRERRRESGVSLDMSYKAIGSTGGKKAITDRSEHQVEYAGSDVQLSEKEENEFPNIMTFPTMAGPVVFGYNLKGYVDGKPKLTLSMDISMGIYNGSITSWDHEALRALNPNLTLPRREIQVIARSDNSGTTHTVTSAFSINPAWNASYGSFFASDGWNNNTIKYYGSTTRGITGLILSFPFSIGYLGWADAEEGGLTYAVMKNWAGHTVNPTLDSVQLAMEKAAKYMDNNLIVELSNHQMEESYPIASFTYMLVRMDVQEKCDSVRELARYIYWLTKSDDAIRACTYNKMVPVSPSIANRIEELVLFKLTCDGREVWPVVKAQIEAEESKTDTSWHMGVIIGATILATLLIGISAYFLIRQIRSSHELDKDEWDVPIEEIVFYTTAKSTTSDKSRFVMWNSVRSLTDVDDIEDGFQMVKHILQWPGKWNGLSVGLRLLEIQNMLRVSRPTKRLLLWMRDEIIHNSVLNFYGLAELQGERYVVSDYCSKGPLLDVLKETKYNFNKDCKFSLALDIIGGLAFLHSKGIIHGNLRTTNCLVDFKWTVKIADWEYCQLFTHLYPKKDPLQPLRKSADEVGKDAAALLEFWTAPELLKSDDTVRPTIACDIYSYAIILQEIFTRNDAYSQHLDTLLPSEVLKAIISNNLRPSHDADTPTRVKQILEYGWSESPSIRPTCEQVQKMLRQAHNFKKSVLDIMVEASEEYTNSIEEALEEKSGQLEDAEAKVTILYDHIMPPFLQKKLLEKNKSSDIDITSSASVIMIKVIFEGKQRKKKFSLAKAMNHIDYRLSEITKLYKAIKIDYANGVYLLIYGACSREKRKAIQAARMTYEIIAEETDAEDSSKDFKVSYQCAIHHGSLYTGLVKNNMPPKYFTMGDVIGETHKLLHDSKKCMVLVSRSFKDALTIFALDYFRLEANATTLILNDGGESTETYWLYRKEGMEYKKWHAVINSVKQLDMKSSTHSSATTHNAAERTNSLYSHQSISAVNSSNEEVPLTKISSLFGRNNSNELVIPPTVERSISAPFISGLYNPFTSYQSSSPLTRSNTFTAGTIASLRNLLARTLPSSPSYKMKIISQSGSEDTSDNFDALPV